MGAEAPISSCRHCPITDGPIAVVSTADILKMMTVKTRCMFVTWVTIAHGGRHSNEQGGTQCIINEKDRGSADLAMLLA